MSEPLDEIDRRIIYRLMTDARHISAPEIAEETNVSARTIRNRIQQLEEQGIITGYHAQIDFERTGGRLTNLFVCSAPVSEQEQLVEQILRIPGVVNVRELISGPANLHVIGAGTGMNDITRIAQALSALGLEIEAQNLVQREHFRPYHSFGPEESETTHSITNFISLTGDAEVIELTVERGAPIAGRTVQGADTEGLLGVDTLIVAIERDGSIITPKGGTTIQPDDVVTIFSQQSMADETLQLFSEEASNLPE